MNKPQPKITVITANYNQGSYIETCINSVLQQNYTNLEYIIFDGGSSDQSVDIIKKYSEKLSYWVSEKDQGQTHAINKGLTMATGEIITWLNADDYFLPGALQKAADNFKRTNFDFYLGNCIFVDENGNKLNEQFKSTLIDNKIFIPGDHRCRVHQPSSFFSKKIIQLTGLLDTKLHYAMDVDFWMKIMANNGIIIYEDVDLTFFRRHDESKSSKGNLPFIKETLQSVFFKTELKLINKKYFNQCEKSIFKCYYDNLLLEHKSKEIFSFFPKIFTQMPIYSLKKIIGYVVLKLKLKLSIKRIEVKKSKV